ncbi:hypothetical protein SS50377_25489 [Spironucleus salmonicida]|uniref:SNF7 family protein n=1 Tax=Spironucleus salmonicida TaxID=348837 RepID=V6LMU6_9EUKA|nr:hypothetical protein SS50377_25489 [Spironucleus salmonicida]|eukprot:EST45036.1 Hypothetical protein SS50377_15055 [Spironucleus salmonicida]
MGAQDSQTQQSQPLSSIDITLLKLKKVRDLLKQEVKLQSILIAQLDQQVVQSVPTDLDKAQILIVRKKIQQKIETTFTNMTIEIEKQVFKVENFIRQNQTIEILNSLSDELKKYDYDEMVLELQEIKQSLEFNDLTIQNINQVLEDQNISLDLAFEIDSYKNSTCQQDFNSQQIDQVVM